jgi:hypothetical protein
MEVCCNLAATIEMQTIVNLGLLQCCKPRANVMFDEEVSWKFPDAAWYSDAFSGSFDCAPLRIVVIRVSTRFAQDDRSKLHPTDA